MTDDIFLRLRRLVHGDKALQSQLFALDDIDAFIEAIRALASQIGYETNAADIRQTLYHNRQIWLHKTDLTDG